MLEASYLELHLGILQNRLRKFSQTKGQAEVSLMHATAALSCTEKDKKSDMDLTQAGKDKELLELEIKALDKKIEKAEEELAVYEDEVLKLTQL